MRLAIAALAAALSVASVPLPNARQVEFMELEFMQFMHFGIPTFWDPPEEYLYTQNPTYHDCYTTTIDHGNQTGSFYPCLDPLIFAPTDFSADDWMANSVALGTKEICLTAHHEGGFALWPTNHSRYSVALSRRWKGGKGDVLREFVDAANRWGIKICYYLNVAKDGYETLVDKQTPAEYIAGQVGMITEVLTEYGPVNRFWFDGTTGVPAGTNLNELWQRTYAAIRELSPSTLISPYRGDVCAAVAGGTLYTHSAVRPNSTDTANCGAPSEDGEYFFPTEMHGITLQMGPDGNTGTLPTYWFWHPWACAGNVSGCPWQGHANASRIFDAYIPTVGHGAVFNFNAPPERTGRMNASVSLVMHEAGAALNATFRAPPLAGVANESAPCATPIVLELPADGPPFDYIVTMEDLAAGGQRIANYSIEYQPVGGSPTEWLTLVPPVWKDHPPPLGDRPDGNDPRDSHIGRKRIDTPVVPTGAAAGAARVRVARVRFSCLRALEEPYLLRAFEVREKQVPWEPTWRGGDAWRAAAAAVQRIA